VGTRGPEVKSPLRLVSLTRVSTASVKDSTFVIKDAVFERIGFSLKWSKIVFIPSLDQGYDEKRNEEQQQEILPRNHGA
jgi:hypothetical protein